MQAFAESRFWRAMAVLLVAGLFWAGSAGDRTILPVAQAGGVVQSQVAGGAMIYATTDETGGVLYLWNPMLGVVDRLSFGDGAITRRPLQGVPGGGFAPGGGYAPGYPGQPQPPRGGSDGSWAPQPQPPVPGQPVPPGGPR